MDDIDDVFFTFTFRRSRRALEERHQHVHPDPVDSQTRALINRMLKKNDLQRNKPNILITGKLILSYQYLGVKGFVK